MLKRIALYGFIAYLSLFLVFIQPIKVSANPALGGIIISQLARTGLQKASQQVGIAVATRAGVRISTSAAAKAAHARWFQTSAHAASTAMTSSTKVAGQGTVSGWLKVLMGGMLADSLITNTKNMYTSISNLINSLGGVPVAEGSEISNMTIANEITSIPDQKTWLKADFVSEEQCFLEWREYWSCLVPGLNRSTERIYTGKPTAQASSRSIAANTDFLFCPVGETILVNYTDYISYISVSDPEIILGASKNTTSIKAEWLSINISTGEVSRSKKVLSVPSSSTTDIAPIYGLISTSNADSDYIAFSGKTYVSYSHLFKPSGHTFCANPISSNFLMRTVTLAADSVTVSEPAPASTVSPLVIQVPDLKAIAAANPTATEDEIHDIALNMILENPEIVSGAESCTYTEGEIEAMPEYFSPEYHVSDPDPDPDPDPDLGFDFSGILGFLQSILDAISSIVNYLNPFSEDFFLYIAFVPQTEAISTSVAALQAQAEITFAFIFDIRDILLGVMSGTFTDEEWEGLWIRGHWLVGDVCVVSPVPTNTWAPDIKFWIGGFVVFLTMLVTIKRIRNFMSA
jgi:hypothetical protein